MHNILPDLPGHKNLESHAYYVSGCICGLTLAVVQHKHKIPDSHKKLLHKSLMVNSRMSCGGPPKENLFGSQSVLPEFPLMRNRVGDL